VNMDLIGNNGVTLQSATRTVSQYGALQSRLDEIFPVIGGDQFNAAGGAYVRMVSSMPLRSYEEFTAMTRSIRRVSTGKAASPDCGNWSSRTSYTARWGSVLRNQAGPGESWRAPRRPLP